MAPSQSVELSVKVTCWPVWGLAGRTVKAAVGGGLGGVPETVTWRVVVAVAGAASSSVTRRPTVKCRRW